MAEVRRHLRCTGDCDVASTVRNRIWLVNVYLGQCIGLFGATRIVSLADTWKIIEACRIDYERKHAMAPVIIGRQALSPHSIDAEPHADNVPLADVARVGQLYASVQSRH